MGRDGHRAVITNRAAAAVSIIGPSLACTARASPPGLLGFYGTWGRYDRSLVPCGTCRPPGGFEEEATSGSCERLFFCLAVAGLSLFCSASGLYPEGIRQREIRGEFPSDISLCNISALLQSHSIPWEHHGWYTPAQHQITAVSSNRFSDTVADAPRVWRGKCGNVLTVDVETSGDIRVHPRVLTHEKQSENLLIST